MPACPNTQHTSVPLPQAQQMLKLRNLLGMQKSPCGTMRNIVRNRRSVSHTREHAHSTPSLSLHTGACVRRKLHTCAASARCAHQLDSPVLTSPVRSVRAATATATLSLLLSSFEGTRSFVRLSCWEHLCWVYTLYSQRMQRACGLARDGCGLMFV